MDHKTDTDNAELGFYLEERGNIWVVQFAEGGCLPASIAEQKLWQALQAGRTSLAASAGSEPWGACVGGRVWVGKLPAHVPKMGLPIQWLYTHPSPPEGAGWRPIETAPKDGVEIILRRGLRVGAAQWCHWPSNEFEEAGAGWSVCWDGDSWDGEKAPTHWKPLPPPPASEAKERGNG